MSNLMMMKQLRLFCLLLLGIASPLHGESDVSVLGGALKGGKFAGSNPKVFKAKKPKATAPVATIRNTLNAGKGVRIETESPSTGNGDLTVGTAISKTTGKKPASLTLNAVRDLHINKAISSKKGALSVILNAEGSITTAAAITTKGGDVTINTIEPFTLGAAIDASTGKILLQSGSLQSSTPQTVTAASVEVSEGASWQQSGTLAGPISVAGILSAGSQGKGALQINGAVTLQSSGALLVNLGGTGRGSTYGSITSSGTVTLAGALQLDCIDGFEDLILPGNNFTIVSGASISGTFAGLENGSRVALPDELGTLKVTYTATTVTLSDWQPILIDQTWDPGDTDEGTFVYTNARVRGRRHYFRIHTEETDIGAWRSRLHAVDGEADLYWQRGALPSTTSYLRHSDNDGDDGGVLNSGEFAPGQEWFLLVYADPGKPWTFVTGRAFVQDLGPLQWTDTNSNGTYDIGEPVLPSGSGDQVFGGEGMRFFKATVPVGTPAWSLWLNGSDKYIAVRKSVVPFHTGNLFDRRQQSQMLVVPPYLGSGLNSYFVSVVGEPGEAINLDSRIQEVTDMDFGTQIQNVAVNDAPYRVYRVQVPVDQIAWDVSTAAVAGNPNVAIRRTVVAGEFDNDAFSEVPGNVTDAITLVPSFLSDGTWFITVYGTSGYTFTLRNGLPEITPINYTDQKINDQTLRAGWRFYGLTGVPAQLGTLGWELELANQIPGSEIAIRRNAVPSRWRSRANGVSGAVVSTALDYSSTSGFLQRPAHQPDIWYVGVYMPTAALGAFTFSCHPMEPPQINFDGTTEEITNLEPGRVHYVRVDVPQGAQGWDVRVNHAPGENPAIAVRRDLLPEPVVTLQRFQNIPGWTPSSALTWNSGNQWAGGLDWTGYAFDTATQRAPSRLVMAKGQPLEAGTYYVGIYNNSAATIASCSIDSRGVGTGMTYPVTQLDYDGGTATISDLAPREPRYFKVTVPPSSPSWELLLETTAGDAEMIVRDGTIPDFDAVTGGNVYRAKDPSAEIEMKQVGSERYVLLPREGQSVIPADTYYIAVVSEGTGASGANIGTGTSSATLTSVGPLHITNLGAATEEGIVEPVNLAAGQVKAYHFQVPADTQSLEVRLANRVGDPSIVVIEGGLIPTPAGDYGTDGGNLGDPFGSGSADALILTASNPSEGEWSIAINAGISVPASGTLYIKALGVTPVDFDGGTAEATDHQPGTVRYFSVDVPEGVEGWDVRMADLTGGPVPTMVVRRGVVAGPPNLITPGWTYSTFTEWPDGHQATAGVDWTGYTQNIAGPVLPRLVTATDRPLRAGKYFIGIFNNSTTEVLQYKIKSFGIGEGRTYRVADLDYTGAADINDLAPREAKYFKVNIPAATPNWEVTLSAAEGEIELLARAGAIPDFAAVMNGNVYAQNPTGAEIEMKKLGPERYVLLPALGTDLIPAGVYYLAAVAEGVDPAGSTIGTGTSSGVLKSGPLAVKDLGMASPAGTVEPVDLVSAQIKAYQFTVPVGTDSLEVRLDNAVGNPWVSLVQGTRLPTPPGVPIPNVPTIGAGPYNEYGCDGGNNGAASTHILTVANPVAGEWRVLVRAGHGSGGAPNFPPASADLVVTALQTAPVAFDGGTFTVNAQQPGTWRYFAVDVPAEAKGWDIRVRDVNGTVPAMMVRRDILPAVPGTLIPATTSGWSPVKGTTWPSGNQWLAGVDWTGYSQNVGGGSVPPRLVCGMGHPLEAGTYFVGVYNNTLAATSYTIDSRGIGDGMTYPVTDLTFAGGTANITDLPGREARYFKVSIPDNTPSWEVTLDANIGDVELVCRLNTVPDFEALREGAVYDPTQEVEMKKAGSERYVLLPLSGQEVVPAGTYYLAVVSEGVNASGTVIGTGASTGVLTSVGTLAVKNLGAATTEEVTEAATLAGGQLKAYQFTVAPGTDSLEMRLDGAVGFPAMSVVAGSRLPLPAAPPLGNFPYSEYGHDGGSAGGDQSANIYTVLNPTPGPWSVLLKARHDAQFAFPSAAANLIIKDKENIPLNFAESLNAEGGSHTDRRQAVDGEYNVYEVAVPANLDGQPVLGWVIETALFQGAVSIEVYKTYANRITLPTGVAVVVPPFLTPGDTWYIRVKATGLTDYQITSRPVVLERPVWQMPNSYNISFGDSGNDSAGNPLPGDRGVDLAQGYWHFYAIDVPADNAGLLRTELRAISGNPDLYLREDGVPTVNHLDSGSVGKTLAPRSLTGTTTEYGNWVPLNGKTETRLRPGRWYLGVRAQGNSNARYRLIASTGTVKDLALNTAAAEPGTPASVTDQSLADNDWRYYRFVVPEDAPKKWTLTFSQQVGDVVMWLRDTVPPGQGSTNANVVPGVVSWQADAKNQGPYALAGQDAPKAYEFTTPPLRPGHVYYVGMRSNNSATFSLSSDTSGGTIESAPVVDFYIGTASATVPANGSVLYKVPVPPEAVRIKYTTTHVNTVSVRVEQGTLPGVSGTQHFIGSGTNSSLNQALGTWPWVPNQTYYIRFVNSTATPQPITLTMNGKNAANEDEDLDGLPDAWERLYFNTLGQNGAGDFDNDGVSNATEYADGTLPNDANSAKYALTVIAKNGTVSVSPQQAKYDKGSVVTVTNIPNDGYEFVSWSGGPFRGDDFAIKATGTITIPTGGTWTFGVNAADGVRLKVNGTAVLTDNNQRDLRDTFGQIALAAGTYPIELVAFERTRGEGLELFAAPGAFTSFNAAFELVGDVANGGLAVQTTVEEATVDGFTVRQVESASAVVNTLTVADNLLAGSVAARQDVTGVIDVINFLTYNFSEGHFTDNAHFPLTAAIHDQPLLLPIKANYTITALNSIPLETALDTTGLAWSTGSNVPWLGENDPAASDATDAAGSGPLGDSQSSSIQTVVTGPGTLSFKWKVSSMNGDFLVFLVDGVQAAAINGEVAWTLRNQAIGAGVHTVTWTYAKDATGSAGSDRGGLDAVVFTPQ